MSARARRPISRRLMVTMFVLMLAPMGGWFFATEPPGPALRAHLSPEAEAALEDWRAGVRKKLGATFVFTIFVMGAGVVYVRRSMIDPLADLAGRARAVGAWQPPPDLDRSDEIGDLGRALDESVTGLQARAEEAVRFAVSLSHELRTPLAAIKGAAEILADASIQPADRTRFVANIAAESDRLERLVAGLLDLERSRQGGAPPSTGHCDLAETVRIAIERAAPLWQRKALRVNVETQDNLPHITTDSDRATRVLLGLLENAVKFAPKNSDVRVQIRAMDSGVTLVVEDSGPGVPDDMKAKVFDRTFVGDRGSGARGTGLGLAIVQSLVARAGGHMRLEDAMSGGAKFTAWWPIVEDRLPLAAAT